MRSLLIWLSLPTAFLGFELGKTVLISVSVSFFLYKNNTKGNSSPGILNLNWLGMLLLLFLFLIKLSKFLWRQQVVWSAVECEGEKEMARQGEEAAGARRRRIEDSGIDCRLNRRGSVFWHLDNFQEPSWGNCCAL